MKRQAIKWGCAEEEGEKKFTVVISSTVAGGNFNETSAGCRGTGV